MKFDKVVIDKIGLHDPHLIYPNLGILAFPNLS